MEPAIDTARGGAGGGLPQAVLTVQGLSVVEVMPTVIAADIFIVLRSSCVAPGGFLWVNLSLHAGGQFGPRS
eukprot:9299263-Pyramimonas_sp.AAC.1